MRAGIFANPSRCRICCSASAITIERNIRVMVKQVRSCGGLGVGFDAGVEHVLFQGEVENLVKASFRGFDPC